MIITLNDMGKTQQGSGLVPKWVVRESGDLVKMIYTEDN